MMDCVRNNLNLGLFLYLSVYSVVNSMKKIHNTECIKRAKREFSLLDRELKKLTLRREETVALDSIF